MIITKEEINALTVSEKHQLLNLVWESLSEKDNLDEESEEELQLLQERMEEYKTNPSAALSWEEVLRSLKNKD